MSFWAILRLVIKWLPVAIDVVLSIVKAIRELKNPKERAIAMNELSMAIKETALTGDLGPVEAVKDYCGLRCRIDRRRAQREAKRHARNA